MSQMAAGSYPARNSHGKWAAYFGGPEILASLGDEIFWRPHVVVAAFSAVLQLSLLVVKSVKSKTLISQQATAFVLAGNFLNINGILATVSLTGSFIFLYVLFNNDSAVKSYDNYPVPPRGILVMTAVLVVFQMRPYFTNHALRYGG